MNKVVRLVTTHKGKYWAAEYRDSANRRRYHGLGPKDSTPKREALRLLADFQATLVLQPARRDVNGRTTLAAWGERYIATRADLSEGALALAAGTIKRLKEFFGEGTALERITPAGATDFHNWLRKLPSRQKDDAGQPVPVSPATVSRYIRDARAIFARALRERAVSENPFRGVDIESVHVREDWEIVTMAQLDAMLEACPDDAHRCLFALCRLAGLRLGTRGGEALGLTWGDVDWEKRTMLVWDQKNGRQRIVPVQPKLYGILRECFDRAPEGSTLVCDVYPNNLYRRVEKILAAAGVAAYSKPFHTLRKNLETEWLNQYPLPAVCKWLGNSPAVAMAHYHRADAASALSQVTGEPEMRHSCDTAGSESQETPAKRV